MKCSHMKLSFVLLVILAQVINAAIYVDDMESVMFVHLTHTDGGLTIDKSTPHLFDGDKHRLVPRTRKSKVVVSWRAPQLRGFTLVAYSTSQEPSDRLTFYISNKPKDLRFAVFPMVQQTSTDPDGAQGGWIKQVYTLSSLPPDVTEAEYITVVFPPRESTRHPPQIGQITIYSNLDSALNCFSRIPVAGTRRAEELTMTAFTIPKPFSRTVRSRWQTQFMSLRSLSQIPRTRVFVFGDEPGVAEMAATLPTVTSYGRIATNDQGTPLLPTPFRVSAAQGDHVLMYSNADLVFSQPDQVMRVIERVSSMFERFMLIGRRRNVANLDSISTSLQGDDLAKALESLPYEVAAGNWIDYMIFSNNNMFADMPPLAVGRAYFDWYLLHHAAIAGAAIVDVSDVLPVYHPMQDYSHVKKSGVSHRNDAPDTISNAAIIAEELGFELKDNFDLSATSAHIRKHTPLWSIESSLFVATGVRQDDELIDIKVEERDLSPTLAYQYAMFCDGYSFLKQDGGDVTTPTLGERSNVFAYSHLRPTRTQDEQWAEDLNTVGDKPPEDDTPQKVNKQKHVDVVVDDDDDDDGGRSNVPALQWLLPMVGLVLVLVALFGFHARKQVRTL